MTELTYERSGGIAGDHSKLELSGGRLTLTDRRAPRVERAATQDELKRIDALVSAASTQKSSAEPNLADGYTFKVTVGGRTSTLTGVGLPFGKGDGSPLAQLIAYLDGLVEASLSASGQRKVLDPSLLE